MLNNRPQFLRGAVALPVAVCVLMASSPALAQPIPVETSAKPPVTPTPATTTTAPAQTTPQPTQAPQPAIPEPSPQPVPQPTPQPMPQPAPQANVAVASSSGASTMQQIRSLEELDPLESNYAPNPGLDEAAADRMHRRSAGVAFIGIGATLTAVGTMLAAINSQQSGAGALKLDQNQGDNGTELSIGSDLGTAAGAAVLSLAGGVFGGIGGFGFGQHQQPTFADDSRLVRVTKRKYRRRMRFVGGTLIGLGTAAVAIAGGLGAVAAAEWSTIEDDIGQDEIDAGEQTAKSAGLAFAVGSVAPFFLGTGIGLIAGTSGRNSTVAKVAPTPMLTRGGAGFALSGQF